MASPPSSPRRDAPATPPSLREERRKPGWYYLLADRLLPRCGKLPLRLPICPTCGFYGGVQPRPTPKPVSLIGLFYDRRCLFDHDPPAANRGTCHDFQPDCPLGGAALEPLLASRRASRALLVWIPVGRYPRRSLFALEAEQLGVRWPVRAVPPRLRVGGPLATVLLFAHVRAIMEPDGSTSPGIVEACRVRDIEYIAKPNDSPERLRRITKCGVPITGGQIVRYRMTDRDIAPGA